MTLRCKVAWLLEGGALLATCFILGSLSPVSVALWVVLVRPVFMAFAGAWEGDEDE